MFSLGSRGGGVGFPVIFLCHRYVLPIVDPMAASGCIAMPHGIPGIPLFCIIQNGDRNILFLNIFNYI
jgi:hypothetical protein